MGEENELLPPPPPKKVIAQSSDNGVLPPPPKKKDTTNGSSSQSEPVSSPFEAVLGKNNQKPADTPMQRIIDASNSIKAPASKVVVPPNPQKQGVFENNNDEPPTAELEKNVATNVKVADVEKKAVEESLKIMNHPEVQKKEQESLKLMASTYNSVNETQKLPEMQALQQLHTQLDKTTDPTEKQKLQQQIDEMKSKPLIPVLTEFTNPSDGKKIKVGNGAPIPGSQTVGEVWDRMNNDRKAFNDAHQAYTDIAGTRDELVKSYQELKGFKVNENGIHEINGVSGMGEAFQKGLSDQVDNIKMGLYRALPYLSSGGIGGSDAFAPIYDNELKQMSAEKYIKDAILKPTETKGYVAQSVEKLGGVAPLAVQSAILPESTLAQAVMGGTIMGASGLGAGFHQAYTEAKSKNMSDADATAYAKKVSNIEGATQATLGAVLPLNKLVLGPAEGKAFSHFLQDTGLMSTEFAAQHMTSNALQGKNPTEGVQKVVEDGIMLSLLTHAISTGTVAIKDLPSNIKAIYDVALANRLPDMEGSIKAGIKDGTIDPEKGTALLNEAKHNAEVIKKLPPDWTPEEMMVAKPFQEKIDNLHTALSESNNPAIKADIQAKIDRAGEEMITAVGQHRTEAENLKVEKGKNLLKDDELLSAYVDSNKELSDERQQIANMKDDELRKNRLELFRDKANEAMPDKFVEDYTNAKKEKELAVAEKEKEAEAKPSESNETTVDEAKEPVQEKSELTNKDDIEGRRKQEIADAENNPSLDAQGKKEVVDNINAKHDAELESIKRQENDSTNSERQIPSEERVGEKSLEAKSDESGGAQKTSDSGVVQTSSGPAEGGYQEHIPEIDKIAKDKGIELTPDDKDHIAAMIEHTGDKPEDVIDFWQKNKEQAPEGSVIDQEKGVAFEKEHPDKVEADNKAFFDMSDEEQQNLLDEYEKSHPTAEVAGDTGTSQEQSDQGASSAPEGTTSENSEAESKTSGQEQTSEVNSGEKREQSESHSQDGLGNNDEEWTPIRRQELTDAKDHFRRKGIAWTETMNDAMASLANETPSGGTIYDTAIGRVKHMAEKIRNGEKLNPNSEEVAAMAYARAKTRSDMAKLSEDMSSPDPNVKSMAELKFKELDAHMEAIDSVLGATASEAGRAFVIRQIEGKMNVGEELKIRRMQIEASGKPMTAEMLDKLEELIDATKAVNDAIDKLQTDSFEDAVKAKGKNSEGKSTPGEKPISRIAKRKADAKAKIADATDRLLSKIGGKSNLTAEERTSLTTDLADIGKGLIDLGYASLDNVIEKIGEHLKGKTGEGFKLNDYASDIKKKIESFKEPTAIDDIKDMAGAENATTITRKMVADGLIDDIVTEHIQKGTEPKDVLKNVTEELKKELPDVTEQQVSDAYLKEGEYKLEKKEKVQSDIAKAKEEIKNITRLQKDIDALEAGKEVTRKTASGDKEAGSEYEKALREKKQALLDEKKAAEEAGAKAEKERLTALKKELSEQAKKDALEQKGLEKEAATLARELEKLDAEIAKAKSKETSPKETKPETEPKAKSEKDSSYKEGKKSTAEVERDLKKAKQKAVADKLKDLKEKEQKRNAESARIAKEENAKYAKLEDINDKIKDVENEGKLWEKSKKNPAKIDEDIAAANKRLDKAITDSGMKVDKNVRPYREAKEQSAKAHNDRMTEVGKEVADHIASPDLSTEEKAVMQNVQSQLENVKIDTDSKQSIDQMSNRAKEKMSDLYEHVKEQAKKLNSEPLREVQKSLKESMRKFNEDATKTGRQIQADRRVKYLESGNKERTRRIAAGEVEAKERPANVVKNAKIVQLEIKKRKLDSQIRKLAHQKAEREKGFVEKAADTILESRVAALITNLWGVSKIGLSAVTKQPLEFMTRQTTGRIANLLNPRLSEAAGGEGPASLKQEQERLRAQLSRMTPDQLEAKRAANTKSLETATDKLNQAKAKLQEIETEYKGKESAEYKAYEKGEYKAAEAAYKKANLDVASNVIYDWIGASSTADAAKIWTQGLSHIEEAMGDNLPSTWKDAQTKREQYLYLAHTMGRVHSMLKNFSARGEFAANYIGRLEQMQRKGVDISDPANQILAADGAYTDGFKRGKYMNDNLLTNTMKGIVRDVESGRYDATNRFPLLRKGITKILKFDSPIVKVPSNIANEAITEYTLGSLVGLTAHIAESVKGFHLSRAEGAGLREAFQSMSNHIAELPPEKADFILRCYRKGGIGLGLVALSAIGGVAGIIKFGGFYDEHEKKHPGDLGFGEIEIGGHKLPKRLGMALSHLPITMPAMMALNYIRVRDIQEGKFKTPQEARNKALMSDLNGIMDDNPYKDITNVQRQLSNPTWIPGQGIVKDISEQFDTDANDNIVQRKPESFMDKVKMSTGIDRSSVPEKKVESGTVQTIRDYANSHPEASHSDIKASLSDKEKASLSPQALSKHINQARFSEDERYFNNIKSDDQIAAWKNIKEEDKKRFVTKLHHNAAVALWPSLSDDQKQEYLDNSQDKHKGSVENGSKIENDEKENSVVGVD